ncbi:MULTISPECIES: CDP-diacylglycerol--serine O-phosphatidyltransferase [Kordiimonas]|jgi:CDP-diacylglycerol--serine O-phosphatidyltransferase|uniref:CDP-diacylglycerol--serine O-phosphatidyltransferase n=1 Tax=Kordiimonas TaxID=288021 RepID=UPI00257E63E4|nr:CDP-diacylglycerol--serine O-phosphatidyltransferase [Kordiimonas sp. UBA4487]
MGGEKRALLFKKISIRTILPNVVTLLAFMSGLTSIKFALADKWELAVFAILLAGIFDGLDGTVARLLKSTSRFGAELDSLSDVVSFGVAPAVILYLWVLEGLDRLGWAVALIYAISMALRLARFNAKLDDEEEPRKRLGFLTGVPAPAGATLLLMPLIVDFALEAVTVQNYGLVVSAYAVVVAVLMVSTIPTISLKAFRVPKAWFVPVMLVIGIVIAGLFVRTWAVLIIIAIAYLSSMPFSYVAYERRRKHKQLG